jgi:hypothetical protein
MRKKNLAAKENQKKLPSLVRQFLPKYKEMKLTLEEACYAVYYILNGRDGKLAYSQAYKIPLSEIVRGSEAYYGNLCLNSDPRIQEAAEKILDRFFLYKKEDLKKRLLEILQEQAFYDPAEIIKTSGILRDEIEHLPLPLRCVIRSVKTKAGKDGKPASMEVELADRMAAVKILGDYAGIASPVKSELSLSISKEEEKELSYMFMSGMKKQQSRNRRQQNSD